ncbi:MAG TPA: hypothetical protein ENN03_11095 [bacterium]|nr:hypothetical protein [bacterium]
MFTPEKMAKIHILFSQADVHRVAEAVVRQGSLQLVDAGHQDSWARNLVPGNSGEEPENIRRRREQVEGLLADLNIATRFDGVQPLEEDMNRAFQNLDAAEKSIQEAVGRVETLNRERERLDELESRVDRSLPGGVPLLAGERVYLTVEIGVIAEADLKRLKIKLQNILHILTPIDRLSTQTRIIVVGLRRDAPAIRQALMESGFQPTQADEGQPVPSSGLIRQLKKERDVLEKQQREMERRLKTLAGEHGGFLLSLLLRLRRETLAYRILKYFRKTERTYLLAGWIPWPERNRVIGEIRKAAQNRCIVEVVPADGLPAVRKGEMDVPVRLRNPGFLRPFELLTRAYGMPSYRTIDPTAFLAVSFLIMFGVMFGDAGHGLFLLLTGFLMSRRARKETFRQAGALLVYAGVSSVVFGVLFGSFFGIESLFPALWLKPMDSIGRLFTTAVYFGAGMIFLSIFINIINGLRNRDFWGMLFDKAGLLSAVLYWTCLVVGSRVLTGKTGSGGQSLWITGLMTGSLVLLFLREPILQLIHGKRKLFPDGVGTTLMGGLVETLEILLGFLANTVSFIRVAAFGLAHAGLFIAIFALSDSVSRDGGGVASWVVLIFGNLIIIGLEGLVVSIQAVRLEFYEFFGRFFQTAAGSYTPLESDLRS